MESKKDKIELNDELLDKVSGGWGEAQSDYESAYCSCINPVPNPFCPCICNNCMKMIP